MTQDVKPLHLDSLHIQNYRMFEDFKVNRLGRVNLIVGKNNSGKSTVLEAVRVYAAGGSPKTLKEILKERQEIYIRSSEQESNNIFDFFFTNYENSKIIKIGSDDNKINIQYKDNKNLLVKKNDDLLYSFDFPKLEELNDNSFYRAIELHNNKNITKNTILIEPSLNRDILNKMAENFDTVLLIDVEYEEKIINILKFLKKDVEKLRFVQAKKMWHTDEVERIPVIKLKNSKYQSLKSMGDGMLRVLQLALKIPLAKDGFLLIDEFENGLHYSVQDKIWNMIFEIAEELNIQVFATTHSMDCVESFSKVACLKKEQEGILFRVGKAAGTDQVIATVYDEEDLATMTKAKLEVR